MIGRYIFFSPDISRDDNLVGLELTVEPEQEDLFCVGDLGGNLRHPVLHVSAVTPEVFFRKVQCVWKADLEENLQLLLNCFTGLLTSRKWPKSISMWMGSVLPAMVASPVNTAATGTDLFLPAEPYHSSLSEMISFMC